MAASRHGWHGCVTGRRFTSGVGDAGVLKTAVDRWPLSADTTLVALGSDLTAPAITTLLTAVRHAARCSRRLVLVHSGAGGTSLLQALRRERPGLDCASIEVAEPSPAALAAARAHALAAGGPAEVMIDGHGLATTLDWRQAELPPVDRPLAPGDPVVITGGLGGLGCAVACRLSRRFGAHPVVLDCLAPRCPTAQQALGDLHVTGRPVSCHTVDVTDPDQVRGALRPIMASGRTVVVVHCAGVIAGGPVLSLDPSRLDRLVAPKAAGLRTVLAALGPARTRTVIAFGSVLARSPHPGVGGYALANELLRREVDRCARRAPRPRYLTAEWSVWDGAGVAAATGAVKVARQAGYTPIALADGLSTLEHLLAWPGAATSVLVSAEPPAMRSGAAGEHTPWRTAPESNVRTVPEPRERRAR